MNGENRVLLFLSSAGMQLCYLYAAVTFFTFVLLRRTFPLPEAVASFLIAAILMLLPEGRGWRIISLLGLQALAFVPALYRMLEILNSWSDAIMSQTWFTINFSNPAESVGYFVLFLVIVWGLVFWAGGMSFAKQERDYATLITHLDRGLIVFFSLFLIRFYLQMALGLQAEDPVSGLLVFPFLIFSLLAIGLVRNQNGAQRDFLPGYQTLGVMLGFVVVILLTGAGLVTFFLPYMTLAAEKGNDLLRILSAPFLSLMYIVLNWLFGSDWQLPRDITRKQEPVPNLGQQWNVPGWLEAIARILTLGVAALLAIVLLAVLGGLLYWLGVWLFSRSEAREDKPSLRQIYASLFAHVCGLMLFIWRGLVKGMRGRYGAIQLYHSLCTWGSLSGLPSLLGETPNEYGGRLRRRFPMFGDEIELIVQSFNREVYGELVLGKAQMAAMGSAWRTLASPRHYGLRVRAWFRRGSGD